MVDNEVDGESEQGELGGADHDEVRSKFQQFTPDLLIKMGAADRHAVVLFLRQCRRPWKGRLVWTKRLRSAVQEMIQRYERDFLFSSSSVLPC